MSGLSDAQFVALLEKDVRRTLGEDFVARVGEHARHVIEQKLPSRQNKIAEDVQQEFLDTHVRTVWPPCPAHPRHPLWYSDGAWRCSQDATVSIALGQIGQ